MKKKSDADDKYVVKDEKYDRKSVRKGVKRMKTAGLASALKKSEKEMGKTDKPKVKPMKKGY